MAIHKICYDKILPREFVREPNRRNLFVRLPDGRVRAILVSDKQWPDGTTLRVRFLGGTSDQHATVKSFAPHWSKHGNIKFDFNNAPDAEIRITFLDDGAWSYVGTDSRSIPLHAATMNFGWLDKGVVLHEFGHAIGLGHEHQNPVGGIQWNEEAVIRDLSGPPNFWDEAKIRHNVFAKYSLEQIKGTGFDRESIMLYAFPASWTLNGVGTSANEKLSRMDKDFIGSSKGYPFDREPDIVELPVIEATAVAAQIGQPGEEDLFKFNAATAGLYAVETEGPTDVMMKLFGPNSQTSLIAEDDDSGSGRNARITAELSPGTYLVQVRHFNLTGGTGPYSIRVSK